MTHDDKEQAMTTARAVRALRLGTRRSALARTQSTQDRKSVV